MIEAKDLPKMDTFGSCDPYCLVSLVGSSNVYKTKCIPKTYTPKWNETVSFLMLDPSTSTLHVSVRDEDVALDEDISTHDVPLGPLLNGPELDQWVKLTPAKGVSKGGELHYKVVVRQAPPQQYDAESTGMVNTDEGQFRWR
jgi:Ca2+-dependent lipid-binding protein